MLTPLKKDLSQYVDSDIERSESCTEGCDVEVSEDCDKCTQLVEWGIDNGGSNAIINHFKVKPDRREEGLGSKVFQEIEDGLRDIGIDSVVVNMRGGENTSSFLQGRGYEIEQKENDGNYIIAFKEL